MRLPTIQMKLENSSISNFESRLKTLEEQFYLPVNDLVLELPFKIDLKTIEDVRTFDNNLSDYEYMNKVVSNRRKMRKILFFETFYFFRKNQWNF